MSLLRFLLIALMITFSFSAKGLTRLECETILENFCNKYYEDCFTNRIYYKGSLTITKDPVLSSSYLGIWSVEGTHSYYGQVLLFGRRKTHSGVMFKARIKQVSDKTYRVEFEKLYESDPFQNNEHWEQCYEDITIDEM